MQKQSHTQSGFFHFRLVVGLLLVITSILLVLVGFGSFSRSFAQAPVSDNGTVAPRTPHLSPADGNGRFVYLIEFSEPGLVHRPGSTMGQSFKPNTPQVQQQLALVIEEQAGHVRAINHAVGRTVEVPKHFTATHSGIAARLTAAEANLIRGVAGVTRVARERVYKVDTYRGPTFIGADKIWDGTGVPGGVGSRGQGVVVGQLDTGLDPTHPSFADDVSCGHGQGGAPHKLISLLDCSSTDATGLCNGASPSDENGHGTHTSSTSVGNTLTAASNPPPSIPDPYTFMSGVAPCANIRHYKVCPTNDCPEADIQAGMNSVLLHGDVKVMNFSISGGDDPWNDNDRRKLDIVGANIVVAASAGNTSTDVPDPVGNVNHLGPWVMSVAASARDGDFIGRVSAAGPGTPPPGTQNIIGTRGSDSPAGMTLNGFPIRHFMGQPDPGEGCTASDPQFPPGFFNGAIALIHRGGCTFTEKITNAFNAGATMVVIRNNQPTGLTMSTPDQPAIPAYSIDMTPGDALATFVDANSANATATFELFSSADVLANFSLRGPTSAPFDGLTKPDITGPGVNIYAAFPADYGVLSGTSMSSPHLAGSAALVRAVKPTWTAPEVKSALMMTAFEGGHKEDTVTPWDADDVGSGRADLTKAARAGLVMNETFDHFLAADPNMGGDPRTLNIASARNVYCTGTCSWTRTVRNTRTTASNWTAVVNPITPGFQMSVSPAKFSFTGSTTETRQLTISAMPTSDLTGAVAFGEVILSDGGASPNEHITVAIKGQPLAISAVSRKSHSIKGDFDIPLPLIGTPGLESRSGGSTNDYQIVVSFGNAVAVNGSPQATVASGSAMIGSNGVSNGGAVTVNGSTVTVPLTKVLNAQTLILKLNNVTAGTATGDVTIPMSVLVGDVDANGSVNITDVNTAKAQSGKTVTASNFRCDAVVNGKVNASDVSLVKARKGTSLP